MTTIEVYRIQPRNISSGEEIANSSLRHAIKDHNLTLIMTVQHLVPQDQTKGWERSETSHHHRDDSLV